MLDLEQRRTGGSSDSFWPFQKTPRAASDSPGTTGDVDGRAGSSQPVVRLRIKMMMREAAWRTVIR